MSGAKQVIRADTARRPAAAISPLRAVGEVEQKPSGWIGSLSAPVATVTQGIDGVRFDQTSEGFLVALGVSRAELDGRAFSRVLCEEARALLDHAAAAVFESGTPVRLFLPVGTRQRRRRLPLEIRDAGPNTAVIEIVPDLQDVEGRRRVLFDDLNRIAAGTTYVYDRSPAAALNLSILLGFGMSGMRRRARPLREIVHAEDLNRFMAHRRSLVCAKDGEIAQVTVRLMHHDGDWRWIQVREQVLSRESGGKVREVLGHAFDVSEHYALADAVSEKASAVAEAELGERRRIARDLHDSVAQHLVVIDLTMSRMERANAELPAAEVAEIRASVSAIQTEIRTFSFLLHPPELQRLGLSQAIEKLAVGFGRRAGFQVELAVDDIPDTGSLAAKAIFRAAQEAFMNVHKHANAARVQITLRRALGAIELGIADDGVGPGPESERGYGVGLEGMRKRLAELNGALAVTALEPGFHLLVTCPAIL